jgi:hypothetical protein
LISNKIRNIYPAADGGLWIANEYLHYFRDGKFRVWNESDGIKGGVFSLYADGNRLWFGTYSGGLYLLDNGKVISFSQKERNLTSMVFSILEDHAGNLWLSYEGGLQRVSKQELLDYAAGARTDFNVTTFDRRDGLINAEFNATGRNAGWKTADGRLLFTNIHGAVLLNPQDIKPDPAPPTVYVNEVFYNQNPVD